MQSCLSASQTPWSSLENPKPCHDERIHDNECVSPHPADTEHEKYDVRKDKVKTNTKRRPRKKNQEIEEKEETEKKHEGKGRHSDSLRAWLDKKQTSQFAYLLLLEHHCVFKCALHLVPHPLNHASLLIAVHLLIDRFFLQKLNKKTVQRTKKATK